MNTFYYDESEHSRKLTRETFEADNFSENFVASIVGYSTDKAADVEDDYLRFEEKHKKVYTVKGELKSTIIAKKKYVSGFASLRKEDIRLINDLLDIAIKHDLFVYVCVFNKVEYLMIQLLSAYENTLFIDADSLRYSISKLVALYRPFNVYDAIFRNDNSFIPELKTFLKKIKSENETEDKRPTETEAIDQALLLLDDSSAVSSDDWNYGIAFQGFKKYLAEIGIDDYCLIIDKEGDGKTLRSAQREELKNCSEQDSKNYIGLRLSDFIAGIVSSLLKAIRNSFEPGSAVETAKLCFLKKAWFNISEEQLVIYKKLKTVIVDQHKVWDKVYSGKYADNLVYLICSLHYFSSFDSIEQFRKTTVEQHQMNLNSMAVSSLQDQFQRMRNKLPIEAAKISADGVYYNQKGAKCYLDYKKHDTLPISYRPRKYHVLNVGFFGAMEKACVTVLENNTPTCYLLPDELKDWAIDLVLIANLGQNLFPGDVEFRKIKGRYYAEIE